MWATARGGGGGEVQGGGAGGEVQGGEGVCEHFH